MKTLQITIPDSKYGHTKPGEDSFMVKDNVFAVADGITRDPLKPLDFSGISIEELSKNYPNPSPAKMAADTFCQSVTEYLGGHDLINEAFVFANDKIFELNKTYNPKPDYLVNDFYACVASAGIIKENQLHWGCVGDSGVAVFDANGNIKFQSPDGLKNFFAYIHQHSGDFNKPERRKFIRSQFRNNREMIKDGKVVGYGALTGEAEAEFFFQFGKVDLEPNDLIVFYSDGFADTLKEPSFNDALLKSFDDKNVLIDFDSALAAKDYKKFGHERSLIAVLFE